MKFEEDDTPEERENKKIRRLQLMVQLTINLLHQESMNLPEAVKHVEGVKTFALYLFPEKERAWEIIYEPKFHRILRSRWGYVARRPEDLVS